MDITDRFPWINHCSCGREHRVKPFIEISEGCTAHLAQLLQNAGMSDHLHVVLCDNTLPIVGDLCERLRRSGVTVTETVFQTCKDAPLPTAEDVEACSGDARGILAVGTGTICDVSRVAAFHKGIPYAIYATAPSMDGFASSSAPTIINGFKRTLYVDHPTAVIADTEILAGAPTVLKAAGLGDMLGKYIALADWKVAHLLTGEFLCENVADMVLLSANAACALAPRISEHTPDVAGALMEALVLPGLAMDFCGSSRPAAGAEHYLSHCWELLALRDGHTTQLHGRKVGVATIIMADIYNRMARQDYPHLTRKMPDLAALEAYFTTIFPEMSKELTVDPLVPISLTHLEACWPQIRAILSEVPDARTIFDLIKAAGGATSLSDIGLNDDFARTSLLNCRYVRNRLTVFRLMDLLGFDDNYTLLGLDATR